MGGVIIITTEMVNMEFRLAIVSSWCSVLKPRSWMVGTPVPEIIRVCSTATLSWWAYCLSHTHACCVVLIATAQLIDAKWDEELGISVSCPYRHSMKVHTGWPVLCEHIESLTRCDMSISVVNWALNLPMMCHRSIKSIDDYYQWMRIDNIIDQSSSWFFCPKCAPYQCVHVYTPALFQSACTFLAVDRYH